VRVTRELTTAREAAIAREAAADNADAADSAAGSNMSSAGGAPPAVETAAAAAGDGDALSPQAMHLQQQQYGTVSQAGAVPVASPAAGGAASGSSAGGMASPGAAVGPLAAAAGANGASSSGGCFVGGLGLGVSAGALITSSPGGPVQLTAAASGLMGDIERLISATQQSGGQRVSTQPPSRGWRWACHGGCMLHTCIRGCGALPAAAGRRP
jgi:hypothetical protein